MRAVDLNSTARTIYGWEEQGVFFLSPEPYDPDRRQPVNWYNTREEADRVAAERGVRLSWRT